MICAYNYICNFDFVPCIWSMTRIAYIYSRLPRTHSLDCDLQRRHTLFHIFTYRDSIHSLSYILTSSSQPHENVYILQPFSFLFCFFGLTSSSLEHSLRNFIKPQKRQTTNMGEDMFLLGHVAIFLYIDTLHEILSPHIFYSQQNTFNI